MKLARHPQAERELLIFLAFEDRSAQHGGRHRSQQLEELIAQGGWTLEDLPDERPKVRLLTLWWGILAYFRLAFFRPLCIGTLREAGADYYRLTQVLRAHPRIGTLILEGTGGVSLMMIRAAKQKKVRPIIVPQNLESLVPYKGLYSHRLPISARFRQEIALVQDVDAAFCISTEEEWLLRVFGIPAFYLPYRPPEKVAARLLQVRARRHAEAGFGVLLLGSITNTPTLQGFRKLYRMLTSELSGVPVKIHIAGRGTEQLRDEFVDPRIVLHGTVSDEELDDLMAAAEALLLVQAPTSGFLTRVIEARLAGLPIIGNVDAVKGLRDLDGVRVFYQADDLRTCLTRASSSPARPGDPVVENALFLQYLSEK